MTLAFNEPRPGADRSRSAFTLVELLVVIGIIALLIGILLPSLTRARQSAIGIKCRSNLHQISLAFESYLADNHGEGFIAQILPSGQVTEASGTVGTVSAHWAYQLTPVSSGVYSFDVTGGWITKYMKGNVAGYVCPNFTPSDGIMPLKAGSQASQAITGYSVYGTQSYRMSQVRIPPETILAADAVTVPSSGTQANSLLFPTDTLPLASAGAGGNGVYVHARHLKRASVAWMDGHVTAEPVYVYPAAGAGSAYAPIANLATQQQFGTITRLVQSQNIYDATLRDPANYYFTLEKLGSSPPPGS